MCVVSMVMDHYWDKWRYIQIPEAPAYPWPVLAPVPAPVWAPVTPPISPAEVDEFRKLLERAREYDRKNNEPDCELEEKRQRLKKLAEELGVDISFV